MDIDLDIVGYRPNLVVGHNQQVAILCEIIEFQSGGPKQTGKAIRLGMTAADAMRLLALLKSAQQQFGWPENPEVAEMVAAPPAKDRH